MGNFYVDESIHDKAGFVIGACLYSGVNINERIDEIINLHGHNPLLYEFKSNDKYSNTPEKAYIRDDLKNLLINDCKLGLVILPTKHRKELGFECLKGLAQFILANQKTNETVNIYFDEGIFNSVNRAYDLIKSLHLEKFQFCFEQDSKIIKGIQLADLAAHTASIQLKYALGLVIKKVKAGENSGYPPDLEIDLGFEMWATLRYAFFNQGTKEKYIDNPIVDRTLRVEPFGLYISDLCDNNLREISKKTFGEVYLGCIH